MNVVLLNRNCGLLDRVSALYIEAVLPKKDVDLRASSNSKLKLKMIIEIILN